MDLQDLSDTKSLSTFSIRLNPSFTLHLSQQNNTQNHGTTVWDSAKMLAFYLFDTIKKPTFKDHKVQNNKTCLELGSGCGLAGLVMASLGFETLLTDLPEVIDRVLQPNCTTAIDDITNWWHHLQHTAQYIESPKITVQPLDWLELWNQRPQQKETNQPFHYIIASDCIYEIELVEPLLNCIRHYASPLTVILIAMERRDDVVVDSFIDKARLFGFEARMILKKLLNSKSVGNEDVEIWKFKLRKNRSNKVSY
ncbi:putative methyltransferase-domain-containing protein [Parasitella parasitica]|nr:putative methyltransferase-domain-containing protein [Parasitella parasitica]